MISAISQRTSRTSKAQASMRPGKAMEVAAIVIGLGEWLFSIGTINRFVFRLTAVHAPWGTHEALVLAA